MKNHILKNTEKQNGSEDLAVGHLEQATGKSPEPAGRNACPTSTPRKRLIEILENYGLLVTGFDGLRSDAYEKQVAAESPEKLERVYEALLDPALGFKEVRERCPVWPEGSRLAGKLPSMMTLREIKERILLEWKVQDRMKHGGFVERLQEVGLNDEQMMAAAAMILGEELLSAKMNGKPISENLRVLDRMLRIAGLQLRQRREKRRDAENAERHRRPTTGNNDEIRMTNGGKSVQDLAVGHQVSSVRQKRETDKANRTARGPIISGNVRPSDGKNEVILKTGGEALGWLPAVKDRERLESLVGMVMGEPG